MAQDIQFHVVFQDGPLGIGFQKRVEEKCGDDYTCRIKEIVKEKEARGYAYEYNKRIIKLTGDKSRMLCSGLRIMRINYDDMKGIPYPEVMRALQQASRPMIITFFLPGEERCDVFTDTGESQLALKCVATSGIDISLQTEDDQLLADDFMENAAISRHLEVLAMRLEESEQLRCEEEERLKTLQRQSEHELNQAQETLDMQIAECQRVKHEAQTELVSLQQQREKKLVEKEKACSSKLEEKNKEKAFIQDKLENERQKKKSEMLKKFVALVHLAKFKKHHAQVLTPRLESLSMQLEESNTLRFHAFTELQAARSKCDKEVQEKVEALKQVTQLQKQQEISTNAQVLELTKKLEASEQVRQSAQLQLDEAMKAHELELNERIATLSQQYQDAQDQLCQKERDLEKFRSERVEELGEVEMDEKYVALQAKHNQCLEQIEKLLEHRITLQQTNHHLSTTIDREKQINLSHKDSIVSFMKQHEQISHELDQVKSQHEQIQAHAVHLHNRLSGKVAKDDDTREFHHELEIFKSLERLIEDQTNDNFLCNSTASTDLLDPLSLSLDALSYFRERLIKGISIIKYDRKGSSSTRVLYSDDEGDKWISWRKPTEKAEKPKTKVALNYAVALLDHSQLEAEDIPSMVKFRTSFFSLVLAKPCRTLDIEIPAPPEEVEDIVHGFRLLIQSRHRLHLQNASP